MSKETERAINKAASRLCHLSMRYVGAFMEVAQGKGVGLIPQDHPGLHEVRDLINLILLCRAEINALTKCLINQRVLETESFSKQIAEEYEWFAQAKAKFLGVTVTDVGIQFNVGPQPGDN